MDLFSQRRSGVLLHLTSLPTVGKQGVNRQGGLGEAALKFMDFLTLGGFSVWQMLPVGPCGYLGSPYQASSSFAGDTRLLDLTELHDFFPPTDSDLAREFAAFCRREADWLEDYVLFEALHRHFSCAWFDWPPPLRAREPEALASARQEHQAVLSQLRVGQWLFQRQWQFLHEAARTRGITLFGDMPLFVAHDSADVWARREIFRLDERGHLAVNTGVPPDYFAADGQLWGMPHFNWQALAAENYVWWVARLRRQLSLFDIVRIDHFRGLESAWVVPAGETTARNGRWEPGPGLALFDALKQQLGSVPLVAEDLGYITPEVDALRLALNMPGMRVLQFAFDSDAANPHLPDNYHPYSVVYTGTHDNDTTLGWWQSRSDVVKQRCHEYLGDDHPAMPDALCRLALSSVSRLAVFPMQDLLALGSEARMNVPGTVSGNWSWQMKESQATPELALKWRALNALYGRLPN